MARINVVFDGSTTSNGSPLLMHNERLADPIDPYTRWLKELTGKTKKTENDQEEIGRREFLGGGYWAVDRATSFQANPYIPTWNIIRCLQEAGSRHKLGRHVVRGIVPVSEITPLIYEGPTDAAELWKTGLFHSRKGVGVGQKRVIRTRPCFSDWKVELELELDLTILDPETVDLLCREAGIYFGLGDARPRFGRFAGSAELIGDPAEFIAPDVLDAVRERLAIATGVATIEARDIVHNESHPNGKERKRRVTESVK